MLDTETFESTFGPKKTRKRPNLKVTDMEVGRFMRTELLLHI